MGCSSSLCDEYTDGQNTDSGAQGAPCLQKQTHEECGGSEGPSNLLAQGRATSEWQSSHPISESSVFKAHSINGKP